MAPLVGDAVSTGCPRPSLAVSQGWSASAKYARPDSVRRPRKLAGPGMARERESSTPGRRACGQGEPRLRRRPR